MGRTSFSFRCLPGCVNFLGSVRCKEALGAHGRPGEAHNAAFHQLQPVNSYVLSPAERRGVAGRKRQKDDCSQRSCVQWSSYYSIVLPKRVVSSE